MARHRKNKSVARLAPTVAPEATEEVLDLLDLDLEALAASVDGEVKAKEVAKAAEGPLEAFRAAVARLAALATLWRQGTGALEALAKELSELRAGLLRLRQQAKGAEALFAQKEDRLQEAVRRLRVTGQAGLARAKTAQAEAREAKAGVEAAKAALAEAEAKAEAVAEERKLLLGDLRSLPAVGKLERQAREVARGQLKTLLVHARQAGVVSPELASWAAEEEAKEAALAALAATVAKAASAEADEFRLVFGEDIHVLLEEVIKN